jgi:hypothetical protein
LGGGVAGVGGGFQFGDQRGLGGIEPGDPAADGGGLLVAPLGLPGGAGGELGGEHGGPVGAEHPLGEEPGQRGGHDLFADGDGAVIGVGGVVAGQAGIVRAPVVGVGADGGAGHAAVADRAVQPGPELVPAAGPPGGHFGVADVAVPAAHPLGRIPGRHVHQGGMRGLGGPDPLTGRHPHPLAGFYAAAAHHLVAGVLGVRQDLID